MKYYSGTSASGTALSGAPTTVGTYTVLGSFVGSTDYTSGINSTTFTISPAAPTVSVTDASGTYTAAAFTGTATVAGVNHTVVASLEGVTPTLTYYTGTSASTSTQLSGAPTTVGTYTVLASFASSTDYTSGSNSTTFTITPATPTVGVTDASGPYTAAAFTGTATVAGVNHTVVASLEGVTPTLTYYTGTSVSTSTQLSGAPTALGTYTVLASFANSTDYTSASASTTFTVSRATPTVSVSDLGGTASGSTMYPATDSVAGVNQIAGASLEGVAPTVTYYSGTNVTGSPLGGAPSAVGTYTAVASFVGSTDYTSASASVTFTIFASTVSTPTVTVSDGGGTFNGGAFTASDTVAGTSHVAGPSLEGVTPGLTYFLGTSASGTVVSGAPTTAGTYTVLASFGGSADL